MSPEHAIRLWGRGIKSRRSSGLSSRENSALTLTDSDNDNKSDEENGRPVYSISFMMYFTSEETHVCFHTHISNMYKHAYMLFRSFVCPFYS